MSLLTVDELTVTFGGRGRTASRAVDGVSFDVDQGQVVGLVGESGCGKSVTSLALMGLLPAKGLTIGGRAEFDGTDLFTMSPSARRDLRGSEMAMIFQDPLSSLNPVVPIGVQVTEILERHRGMKGEAARKEAAHLLDRVGIPDPTRRLKEYPHQLSGGMRQRALIAMAVACAPRLLIADEPTTALDVTIQAQILELLKELVDQEGTALLMITHDLGVVAASATRSTCSTRARSWSPPGAASCSPTPPTPTRTDCWAPSRGSTRPGASRSAPSAARSTTGSPGPTAAPSRPAATGTRWAA